MLRSAWLALMLSNSALAEQVAHWGNYDIHYNAFSSSSLSAEIAKQYGIIRGGNQGVVNIVVRKKKDNGDGPAQATVSGTVHNLLSQRNALKFREAREEEAIYYLAPFRFDNEDTLTFKITVQPAGEGDSHEFSFNRTLYTK